MIAKVLKYLKSQGITALAVKVCERLKYKAEATAYMQKRDEYKKQYIGKFGKTDENVKISICVPLYNTDEKFLRDMVDSVRAQSYKNWELALADGSDVNQKNIEKIISSYNDERIVYNKLERNLGIAQNSNAAVDMSTGDYVALLDHDDILDKDALLCFKMAIDSGADMIYSDEANFSKSPQKPDIIHFKPDFGIFNLRGNNFICHLLMFKKELFYNVGKFRKGFDGSQDHDLILRLAEKAKRITHIPLVLYYWRVHSGSVASDISAKPYCIESGKKAVKSHLERMGIDGEVGGINRVTSVYRVKYAAKKANYNFFVSDNICFDVDSKNALSEHISLDTVAAVCGLIVKGDKIESGGIIDGKCAYKGVHTVSDGYMNRLRYAQNITAVDCRFCMIDNDALAKVGGFDKSLSGQAAFEDLCRKFKNAGYDVVLVPWAVARITRI